MIVLLGILAVVSVVATVLLLVKDGPRRTPTR